MIFFFILACIAPFSVGDYHDFRQTGTTNIRIDVKDVVIYGIGDLGEYSEENDYSYDYADLTVKPETSPSTNESSLSSSSTTTISTPAASSTELSTSTTYQPTTASSTTKPTATTPKPFVTTSARVPTSTGSTIALENNTIILTDQNKENGTEPNKQSLIAGSPLNAENYQIPVMVVTDNAGKKGYVSSSSIRRKDDIVDNTPALPGRKCLHGFYLDSRNRCKPISRKPVHGSKEKPRLPNGLRYAQRPVSLQENSPA